MYFYKIINKQRNVVCLSKFYSIVIQVNYILVEAELTATVITLSKYLLQADSYFCAIFLMFLLYYKL